MFASLSPLAFAIFFISVESTKLLHLVLNGADIPLSVFVFCLPAVFFVDVLLICIIWILLRRKNASWLSFFGAMGGLVTCIITLAAASSQWGFFYQTGGQVRWADAKAYANKDTIQVLLSESRSALGFGSAIVSVAWITRTWLYRIVGAFVTAAETQLFQAVKLLDARYGRYFRSSIKTAAQKEGSIDALLSVEDGTSSESDLEEDDPQGDLPLSLKLEDVIRWGPFVWWLLITVGALSLFGIIVAIDPDWPYAEMMTTLPLPLLTIFASKQIECTWTRSTWPLPRLIGKSKWEQPRGDFKGWAPGSDNEMVRNYRDRIPLWLPNPAPPGFIRWNEQERLKAFHNDSAELEENSTPSSELLIEDDTQCPDIEEDPFYSPVNDPLRITNLNLDILRPLRQALKSDSVKIKHIALIKLESTREELFPLQQDSDIYKFIMDSHDESDHPRINELLSQLTPNAEKITGKPGNFRRSNGAKYEKPEDEWKDPTPAGFGGINVVGALTPSSVSTKSLAASHCGVWPLAVDTFEEGDLQSYQPCIPQILNMFNQLKTSQNSTDGFRSSPWSPAFFASIIDDYDRQHEFEEKIGFKYFMNRDKIAAEEERNNTGLEVINYFGYPENALTQYIKDYIAKVKDNNERMFLSHFTSTTHHPWGLPNWFQKVNYMGDANGMQSSHYYFNDYLNTVRFVDGWLGQLMGILEETGIANETLVIFVGDHGQAFKEDFKKTGTYDNSHISNYRVPLTFRHPHLPRIQYEANATSLSILPTILDLLIHTDSLDAKDTEAASDLIHDYEGQSLIRPYKRTQNGRRAWNFGIVNPGGHLLTVTSADVPWRLSMPISEKAEFVFTDLKHDPLELKRLSKWSVHGLIHALHHAYGGEAARWVEEAEVLAQWWVKSRKRLWRYRPK